MSELVSDILMHSFQYMDTLVHAQAVHAVTACTACCLSVILHSKLSPGMYLFKVRLSISEIVVFLYSAVYAVKRSLAAAGSDQQC